MAADVAGDVGNAGQVTGVVLAGRLDLRGEIRGVVEKPDLIARPEGELSRTLHGQPHRPLEAAEQRGDAPPVAAHRHELPGLVGGDQKGNPEFLQQAGEPGRIHRTEWAIRDGDGWSDVSCHDGSVCPESEACGRRRTGVARAHVSGAA